MDINKVKPKMKKAYPVVFMKKKVYVGGFGEITKYDDSDGAISRLIKLLDGRLTVEEIAKQISLDFPKYSKKDVREAIDSISKDGFIEDVNLIGSDILTPYELERYHRNINFFSSFSTLSDNKFLAQKKICNAKIGIIGLGGLGSHIVYDLAGLGFGTIKAVEFDKVDISNLNRQILYNFEDIGKSKAKLAQKRIAAFNPEVNFEVTEKKIGSARDIEEEFKGFEALILVADRPKMLLAGWVNEAILKLNVPLFCAGLEAQRAMHYTIIPHQTGCIECWKNSVKDENPVSYAILEERRRLDLTGDNTALVPLVSTITGFLCVELVKYITGIGELTALGKLKSINFNTMETSIAETWELDKNCKVCGGGHG